MCQSISTAISRENQHWTGTEREWQRKEEKQMLEWKK